MSWYQKRLDILIHTIKKQTAKTNVCRINNCSGVKQIVDMCILIELGKTTVKSID